MPDPDFSVSDVNLFVGKFLVYQSIHFLSPLPVPAILGQRWGTHWTGLLQGLQVPCIFSFNIIGFSNCNRTEGKGKSACGKKKLRLGQKFITYLGPAMLRWLYLEMVTMSIYKGFILCFNFFRCKTSIRQSFFPIQR